MENIKYKSLSEEQLIISIDRLTRFKDPETKYLRVFKDIVSTHLILPKCKKSDIDCWSYKKLRDVAEFIINSSIEDLELQVEFDPLINQRIFEYEKNLFSFGDDVEILLHNHINYKALINILGDDIPVNLKWLKLISKSSNPDAESHLLGYRYPINKLIICEGITEEILLPEFARLLNFNFDKNGILLDFSFKHINLNKNTVNFLRLTFQVYCAIIRYPLLLFRVTP